MRWGVRRYQNKDGSLTALGKKHYGSTVSPQDRKRYVDAFRVGQFNRKDAEEALARGKETETYKNAREALLNSAEAKAVRNYNNNPEKYESMSENYIRNRWSEYKDVDSETLKANFDHHFYEYAMDFARHEVDPTGKNIGETYSILSKAEKLIGEEIMGQEVSNFQDWISDSLLDEIERS